MPWDSCDFYLIDSNSIPVVFLHTQMQGWKTVQDGDSAKRTDSALCAIQGKSVFCSETVYELQVGYFHGGPQCIRHNFLHI